MQVVSSCARRRWGCQVGPAALSTGWRVEAMSRGVARSDGSVQGDPKGQSHVSLLHSSKVLQQASVVACRLVPTWCRESETVFLRGDVLYNFRVKDLKYQGGMWKVSITTGDSGQREGNVHLLELTSMCSSYLKLHIAYFFEVQNICNNLLLPYGVWQIIWGGSLSPKPSWLTLKLMTHLRWM